MDRTSGSANSMGACLLDSCARARNILDDAEESLSGEPMVIRIVGKLDRFVRITVTASVAIPIDPLLKIDDRIARVTRNQLGGHFARLRFFEIGREGDSRIYHLPSRDVLLSISLVCTLMYARLDYRREIDTRIIKNVINYINKSCDCHVD